MMNKAHLRRHFKAIRVSLPSWRRREASEKALAFIQQHLSGLVLSYASFQDELNTGPINAWLAAQGRLVLPKVQGQNLALFQVSDLFNQLEPSAFGISEPIPGNCRKVSSQEIDFILVPGLAFDSSQQRLGYGGGYYDRFLTSQSGLTCGLGFCEQFMGESLPFLPFDVPLKSVLLF